MRFQERRALEHDYALFVQNIHNRPSRYGPTEFKDNKRCEAVRIRACLVPKEYERKAITADKKYNGIQDRKVIGPVRRILNTFPQTTGLVFGAYGEVSEAVEQLVRDCSSKQASREWRGLGHRNKEEAAASLIACMRRRIGILGVKAHALMKGERRLEILGNSSTGAKIAAARRTNARRKYHADRLEYHLRARPSFGAPGRPKS